MEITTETVRDFCPTGRLRSALNFGNRVLIGRDSAGRPQGITADLAQDLAARLGVDLEFVEMERAVDAADSATDGCWDLCFLAVDPKRAETITFSAPYVQIDGSYLAGAACAVATAEELVVSGLPVGSVVGSAYSLTLARQPGAEHVVYYEDIYAMFAALDAGEVAAVAGIAAVMAQESQSRPGSRVLSPPFMSIRQAMGLPYGRPEATAFLHHFTRTCARSGLIGDILEKHGVARSCALTSEDGSLP
ncbi:transporter substrate-binding domain-containing protein [Arenibacterium sp. LLYu02]|uniref:transporter substrate-binding domain-containing protein n=1 Tax=Arenibacterium sp. LLYu02 TaxID=3404132 RepID=UPI003B21144C